MTVISHEINKLSQYYMDYPKEHYKLDYKNNQSTTFRQSTDFSVPRTSHEGSFLKIKQTKKLPKQCRICLENQMEAPDKNMIQPCKCNGSVKYVHECCMRKWLTSTVILKSKQQRIKIQQDQGIQCQMCKTMVKFSILHQYKCKPYPEVLIQFSEKYMLLVIFVILIIAAHVGIGFAAFKLSTGSKQFVIKNKVNIDFIIAFSGIILLVLFIIIALGAFAKEFLVQKYLKVGKIGLDFQCSQKRVSNRVYNVEQDN